MSNDPRADRLLRNILVAFWLCASLIFIAVSIVVAVELTGVCQ